MSGIGDYVHARWSNYQRFGIGRNTKGSSSASAALSAARQNIKTTSNLTQTTLKADALSKFLTGFIYGKVNGKTVLTPAEIKAQEQYFASLVSSKLPNIAAGLSLEGGIKPYTKARQINLKNSQGIRESSRKEAEYTISALLYEIQMAMNSPNANLAKLTALQSQGQNVLRKLQGLKMSASTDLVSYQAVATTGEVAKDIFIEYNNLIRAIRQPTQKDYGDLAEQYIAFATASASGVAQEEISKLMAGFVVGGRTAQTAGYRNVSSFINTDVLIEDLSQSQNNNNSSGGAKWSASTNGYTVNLEQKGSRSQQTVDLSIAFSSEQAKKFGVDSINASIKNTRSGIGSIKILDGYPLSAAFALFNTDFVNHYLNLIATHIDGGAGNVDNYNKMIEYGVALRALSGARDMNNAMGMSLSDCLIINDKKSSSVKVINTKSIMNKLNSKNLHHYIHTSGLPTSIGQSWVGNSKHSWDNASKRIAHLLATTHQFKLTMTLKNVNQL